MVIKMNPLGGLLLLSFISANTGVVQAEKVYRSVNEEGETVYSSEPVKGAKEVKEVVIQPSPSQADVDSAKAREKALQRAANSGQSRRDQKRRESDSQSDDKARALAEAEKKLQQAKVIQDSDWQVLAKGGRHLKEEYFERVKKAEAAYEAAKKSLRQ